MGFYLCNPTGLHGVTQGYKGYMTFKFITDFFKRRFEKRLANANLFYYNIKALGPLAQLGERKVRNLEVRGSIPLWSTNKKLQNSRKFWGFIFLCSI